MTPPPFSLFAGDWLNRTYTAIRMGKYARLRLLKRCGLALGLTWLPLALLAWRDRSVGGGWVPNNFFADFAAYAQFVVAMPLFVLAEPIIDASTRSAARQFISCDVVRAHDRPRLYRLNIRIARLCRLGWAEACCVVIAYTLSLAILVPELRAGTQSTWHVHVTRAEKHASSAAPSPSNRPAVRASSATKPGDQHQAELARPAAAKPAETTLERRLTWAGAWEFFIALPVLNYTWLRFGWKILLWTFYLLRVSRIRLELHPTHPDLVGGIGFISTTQGQFAVFILAYGISNIASTVGYEITILRYDLSVMTVWAPIATFIIIAPLIFTLPLLVFTKQLYQSKQRALAIYRQRVTERSKQVEAHWLIHDRNSEGAADEIRDLSELTALGTLFSRVETMRVVPFDMRSFSQLVGSSLGSIATLLPILHVSGNVTGVFDALSKMLGHVGGH